MTKRHRGREPKGYARRLANRGLRRAPLMQTLEYLRAVQGRRERLTGTPFPSWAEMKLSARKETDTDE
jgi:hypothetical protein